MVGASASRDLRREPAGCNNLAEAFYTMKSLIVDSNRLSFVP